MEKQSWVIIMIIIYYNFSQRNRIAAELLLTKLKKQEKSKPTKKRKTELS